MNPTYSKTKGREWENAIVKALQSRKWPHAERRRLAGAADRGDVAGVPGVVIEAKNCKTISLAQFIKEAEAEALNDGADFGVAWVKRRGKTDATDGYVVMTGDTFMRLLEAAGY